LNAAGWLRPEYADALRAHAQDPDERTLRVGYELGRRAVEEGVSALELAAVHHDVLDAALRGGESPSGLLPVASAFLQEVLAAYEMVHRGFDEAATAAAAERRNAAMIRQLASFLADASLSARDSDAFVEVLHLVAEHARELTGATHATATFGSGADRIRAVSTDGDGDEAGRVDALERLELAGPALPRRVSRAQNGDEPALRSSSRGPVAVLTVPIVALDGRPIGQLQLVDKDGRDFSAGDEAVAEHLAGLTAAALERAALYGAAGLYT
jgi:hypothetical protein